MKSRRVTFFKVRGTWQLGTGKKLMCHRSFLYQKTCKMLPQASYTGGVHFCFASFSGLLKNFQDILGLKVGFNSSRLEFLLWKNQVNIAIFPWIYGGFNSEIMDCNCAGSAEDILQ